MKERYNSLDSNNKLIWNLRNIGHTMRHISEGKGSQKRVLMILQETGSITQRELTERLGIQPGSASEVIGKLEAADLLVRSPSSADRRTTNLTLTDSGKAAAADALEKRQERHQQMFCCLSDKEKELLLDLLEKLNSDWDQKFRKRVNE